MAKSVTLWGATYSNVPAIEVPSGNTTAKFIEPSPTTATASDVASGKIFFDSQGNQQTGSASGGSVPYPTFDVTWSNDWSDILSVTCDKTYQYCRDLYLNDADSRAVTIEHDQANTETYYLGASSYMVHGDTDVKYVVSAGGIPELDISYHQNGTISFNYPSSKIIDVTPAASKGTVSNASVSVTPSVSVPSGGGFISVGTRTGTPVTVTASELVSGNLPITQNGNNIDVTNYATVSVNVSGGTSKNVQVHQSTTRATSSTYTNVNSLTCTKSAKYTVYWSTMRSSTSGTSGSQLYIGGTAYGTADTTTWNNHVQNMKLTGVQINANQAVAVYARSRGSNYYAYAPLLTIVEE